MNMKPPSKIGTVVAGAAAALALAVPASAATRPDPGPGVAKDRIEHTVIVVKVSGSKALASNRRIEQWLASDRLRTVVRDVRTHRLVTEVVVDRRGTRIYDAETGRTMKSSDTGLPQLSRDQEAAIVRAEVADGSLRVAEDRGATLALESVPGKWMSDEPGSKTTMVVAKDTGHVLARTSSLPDGAFTQRERTVREETLSRNRSNAARFAMARHARHHHGA